MKKETNIWIEKAKTEMVAAKNNFKDEKYKFSAFLCHQSVEKALIALMIEKKEEPKKVQDLVSLGINLELPDKLIDYCKNLIPFHKHSQMHIKSYKKLSKKFIKYSDEILDWIEQQLLIV